MSIHFSGVNFRNLIRDLADMYPFEVAEVVLTELIANSLDAKATRILIDVDPVCNTLVVQDNGSGMSSKQFREYHDFAAGLKTRGSGIGFAGVGAKISFNAAKRVITETRGDSFVGGSNWHYESDGKLAWSDLTPENLTDRGTRVEVHFEDGQMNRLAHREAVIELISRHYLPLLETSFSRLYGSLGIYDDPQFVVGGTKVDKISMSAAYELDHLFEFTPQRNGKSYGFGVFGLAKKEFPLGGDIAGVLLCTHGKVVKPELFGQFPAELGPRIVGLVESPQLIELLTTSKTDFVRTRGKYQLYTNLLEPIRRQFIQWLSTLGIATRDPMSDQDASKLERELSKLVKELPELSDFFGFRSKSQVNAPASSSDQFGNESAGAEITYPVGSGKRLSTEGILDVGDGEGSALVADSDTGKLPITPISRTARRGPKISFLDAPERVEIAWVQGNGVVINTGHSSYKRTDSNQSARHLHSIFAIATAIQRFLSETSDEVDHKFIDRMLSAWAQK